MFFNFNLAGPARLIGLRARLLSLQITSKITESKITSLRLRDGKILANHTRGKSLQNTKMGDLADSNSLGPREKD